MAPRLHWKRIEGEWWLANEMNQKITKVSYDDDAAQYVDSSGRKLGKTFDGAREAAETAHIAPETGNAREAVEKIRKSKEKN